MYRKLSPIFAVLYLCRIRVVKRLSFLVVVLVATNAAMMAQSTASILDSCEQAMGSQKAERPFYGEGSITLGSNAPLSQHIVWKTKGHDLFRQELSGDAGAGVSIVNQGKGSRKNGIKNEQLPDHATAYFRQEYVPALACAVDRGRSGMAAEYLGQESVGGEPTYHLRFSMAPRGKSKNVDDLERLISEYHVFISVATNRVVATRTWIFSQEAVQNRSLWETFYRDYRDVDGVLMPFEIENRIAGQKAREISLTTVRIDSTIADSDFQ